jgi:hypothetical protein
MKQSLGSFVSSASGVDSRISLAGQRLQSMKKGQDPSKEVDLVASLNAAEKEMGADREAASDGEED